MAKKTKKVRTVNLQVDEHHDGLLEELCSLPGRPRITKTEAFLWSLRETAKREGVTAAAEEQVA